MILIGCAHGGQQCAPIATLPVAYPSEAGCLQARAEIVAASADFGYAQVIAQCKRQGPASARQIDVKAVPTA